MDTDQAPTREQKAEYEAWRAARWDEVAGPNGKVKYFVRATISGGDHQVVDGVPGVWRTTEAGALTVTAAAEDGVQVDGAAVHGTVEVPDGARLEFPGGHTGFAAGGNGGYGVAVMDHRAVARSGLRGIETYPYDPAWVLEGEYRLAPAGRRIEVGRLTSPRSTEPISAPADLVVTIGGTEHALAVVEDWPGARVVIFTDATSGTDTPEIGRWLLVPPPEPGHPVVVDFNQAILSHHHLAPAVFTCPLSPPGNHLPMRIEAGERALAYDRT